MPIRIARHLSINKSVHISVRMSATRLISHMCTPPHVARTYTWLFACLHLSTLIAVHMSILVYAHVCTHIYAHVYTHVSTYADAHVRAHATCMHRLHTCLYTWLYQGLYTCLHACLRTRLYTCLRACLHACLHISTHMSTHTSTHTSTHMSARMFAPMHPCITHCCRLFLCLCSFLHTCRTWPETRLRTHLHTCLHMACTCLCAFIIRYTRGYAHVNNHACVLDTPMSLSIHRSIQAYRKKFPRMSTQASGDVSIARNGYLYT